MQKVNSSKMFEGIDQYTNYPYEYLRCNKSSQVTINRHISQQLLRVPVKQCGPRSHWVGGKRKRQNNQQM